MIEVVARGGQAEVVRALDLLHRRPVALKIRPRGSPQQQDELLAEARLLLGLEPHPHLSVVRGDFFVDDRYYLVMDWIEGRTLDALIGQTAGPGLPLEQALGYLAQLADAIDHLHRQQPPIVHGDVKPANVIVTEEQKVVLVDLGIASQGEDGRDIAFGTEGFMPPELARSLRPTEAADVFGFAATAFALLVGEPPRPGLQPQWRRIAGARAAQVELALRRGLATDPSRRPHAASDLLASLRGERTAPNNLPLSLNSFVGREAEITDLARALTGNRLVTLVGPGGVGKSRLGLSLASELLERHADGAFVVELAPLRDPDLLPRVVLGSLGVTQEVMETGVEASHGAAPRRRPRETLLGHLLTRDLLLVIDNCDHVAAAVASLSEQLLQTCARVRILATSREPLRVPGEIVWPVASLATPSPGQVADLPTLAAFDAVRLFVERAAAARPGFRLTDTNAEAVTAVCARLDGIPLALELAAARVAALSVDEVARRLDDRLRLLIGGSRTGPARHRSLRAAIDWTYENLTPAQQAGFRRLSVFPGTFPLEAAERVCVGETLDERDVVDVLASLVEQSLVSVHDEHDTLRYRVLESLRAYGDEELSPGERTVAHERHVEWVETLAAHAQIQVDIGRTEQATSLDGLETEHDNLRAALRWTISQGEHDRTLRLAIALAPLWTIHAHLQEGRTWLETALSGAPDAPVAARAKALLSLAWFRLRHGELAAAGAAYEESDALSRQGGDRPSAAEARQGMATVAVRRGDLHRARSLCEENVAEFHDLGDEAGLAESLRTLADVVRHSGDTRLARSLAEQSVAHARASGRSVRVAASLGALGHLSAHLGDMDAAEAAFGESMAIRRKLGDRLGVAQTLLAFADVKKMRADFSAADGPLRESVSILREVGDKLALAATLGSQAELLAFQGDNERAAANVRESVALAEQAGGRHVLAHGLGALSGHARRSGDNALACELEERSVSLFRELGDRSCGQHALMSLGDELWLAGKYYEAMDTYREALALGKATGRTAQVVWLLERLGGSGSEGDFVRAARLLGAAEALRHAIQLPRPEYCAPEFEESVAYARDELGPEAFDRAWAEGQAMSLEELVAYASDGVTVDEEAWEGAPAP